MKKLLIALVLGLSGLDDGLGGGAGNFGPGNP
jgi:hypothetical protein